MHRGQSGRSRPGPGWYLIRYAKQYSGKISAPSPAARIRIAADEVIEVLFPPKVNRIPNATFSQIGKDERPVRWLWDLTSSRLDVRDSVPHLITNGLIANSSDYPLVRTEPMEAYPDTIETLRGFMGLVNHESGVARAEIRQYSDNAGNNQLDAPILIKQLNDDGIVGISAKIGPVAEGGTVALNPNTEKIRLYFFLRGNPRNATLYMHSLALHPFDGEPRKFEFPAEGSSDPMRVTERADIPWASRNVVGVSTGQTPEEQAVSNSAPAFETIRFDGSTSIPSGHSVTRSVVNGNTEAQVIALAGMDGTHFFRVRSDHTASKAQLYLQRDFDSVSPKPARSKLPTLRRFCFDPPGLCRGTGGARKFTGLWIRAETFSVTSLSKPTVPARLCGWSVLLTP